MQQSLASGMYDIPSLKSYLLSYICVDILSWWLVFAVLWLQVLKKYLLEVEDLESRLSLATYAEVYDVGIEVWVSH